MHPEQGRAGKLLINACMTDLATNLGISYYAAKKAIDIIVTFSNIALILSLLASVVGAGIFTAGIVAIAKRLALRYGERYAAAW
ncbi:uberolysin/carnocyclin family circular bacteriocin [Rubrobacter naiadicus]|uniref:uberolysin/carnocyclin family circular bacteriocin n=1 Tax=Rubrobacter naiadicus TaxID=1392641 RepID=UPI00235E360A|nr:uberolysin/carnocyclin family circular bacteriocin [Rubrobacter naiadicus]